MKWFDRSRCEISRSVYFFYFVCVCVCIYNIYIYIYIYYTCTGYYYIYVKYFWRVNSKGQNKYEIDSSRVKKYK